jgi:GT2 family glycosyltransferase
VAHFDDDSYPADPGYFATAAHLIQSAPEVAVWCATITSHEPLLEPGSLWLRAVYPGCGHLMNQCAFQRTVGYVERPIAYNLEEVDVSLQLHALGERCVQAADLQVWHDHPTPTRELPEIETAMMVNTILFPFLRYPLTLLPQAALSILRRAIKLVRLPGGAHILGRSLAILIATWPEFRSKRKSVSFSTALSWLSLRRHPIRIDLQSPAPAPEST